MAGAKEKDPCKVHLKNVRLSFASIFEPEKSRKMDDGSMSAPRYKANFLIPKEGDANDKLNMKKLKAAKEAAIEKKYGGGKSPKYKPGQLPTRDGDLEDWDGYEDHWYVSSANKQPVPIVGKNPKRKVQPGDEEAPFSGCYVNAVVRLYAMEIQENGATIKRVNASLEGIQFLRKGEAFGAAPIDPNEEFEDISDEDGDLEDLGALDDDDDDDVL